MGNYNRYDMVSAPESPEQLRDRLQVSQDLMNARDMATRIFTWPVGALSYAYNKLRYGDMIKPGDTPYTYEHPMNMSLRGVSYPDEYMVPYSTSPAPSLDAPIISRQQPPQGPVDAPDTKGTLAYLSQMAGDYDARNNAMDSWWNQYMEHGGKTWDEKRDEFDWLNRKLTEAEMSRSPHTEELRDRVNTMWYGMQDEWNNALGPNGRFMDPQ